MPWTRTRRRGSPKRIGRRGGAAVNRRASRPSPPPRSGSASASLPPSYRNFLLTSDGWNSIGLLDLLGVEETGWFADMDADLFALWEDSGHFAEELPVLRRCLLISIDEGGSGGNWLLHADSVGEDGEWTAYEWWPGDGGDPEPYKNFAAMAKDASDAVT